MEEGRREGEEREGIGTHLSEGGRTEVAGVGVE